MNPRGPRPVDRKLNAIAITSRHLHTLRSIIYLLKLDFPLLITLSKCGLKGFCSFSFSLYRPSFPPSDCRRLRFSLRVDIVRLINSHIIIIIIIINRDILPVTMPSSNFNRPDSSSVYSRIQSSDSMAYSLHVDAVIDSQLKVLLSILGLSRKMANDKVYLSLNGHFPAYQKLHFGGLLDAKMHRRHLGSSFQGYPGPLARAHPPRLYCVQYRRSCSPAFCAATSSNRRRSRCSCFTK